MPELKAGKAAICVRNTSARREATGAAGSPLHHSTGDQALRVDGLPSHLPGAHLMLGAASTLESRVEVIRAAWRTTTNEPSSS